MVYIINYDPEKFKLVVSFINSYELFDKNVSIKMNRATYGGMITLSGNKDDVQDYIAVLNENGFGSNV